MFFACSEHSRILAPEIHFFIHKTALEKDRISADTTLIQLGLIGGTSLAPEEIVLFYCPCGLPSSPSTMIFIDDCSIAWTTLWKDNMRETHDEEDSLVALLNEMKLSDEGNKKQDERKEKTNEDEEGSESESSLVAYISRASVSYWFIFLVYFCY